MADIFISYARQDRDRIGKLAAALEAAGFSVWWDRHIAGGAEFSKDIERELAAATVVIVAWSRQAIESRWVKDEAVAAADAGKLIPISIDQTTAPLGFKQFHVIDFARWNGEAQADVFKDLTRAVEARLTGATVAVPTHASASRPPRFFKPVLLATAGAGIAAIALGLWMAMQPSAAPDTAATAGESSGTGLPAGAAASAGELSAVDPASIAVLPFADLSPEGDQEYFSDGIAEEILNALVQVGDLKVASRTSSFAFKGQESTSVRTIADTLGVKHVLEGSVRKAGNALRITVQLIDTSTDRHLWSETFDRPMTTESVFAVQGEIAAAVVKELGVIMGPADVPEIRIEAPTDDLSAYDLYLEARSFYQDRIRIEEARALLERAIERDPGFVDAWALRAAVISLFQEYTDTELTAEELNALVDESAAHALAFDPDNALAIAARANFRMQGMSHRRLRFDLGEIIADLERAVALDPRNSSAMNWLGLAYALIGQSAKALDTFETCAAVDPLFGPCAENLYDQLVTLERYDEAWERFQAVLARGMVVDGWVNFTLLAHFDQETTFLLAANSAPWLPRWRRQDEIYDAFKNPDEDHSALAADLTAYVRANALDNEPYVNILLTAVGAYDIGAPYAGVLWGEAYAAYRRSPQFKAFILKAGVHDYWKAHGFPPQCKPLGEDDFQCE